ncbi:MOSC domain-containing protein [Labrys okinawensis]|uniref:MOSC domain-containing protein n=1 Tax=Labrys okinawensis TaxID=346911 RepID=A0A2S9QAZ5_9HYPH|nr:MOSC N-terminal beta barrel domain-containing protein [Labrys okinawensis]PRH86522.1 MOSC domain-containing protein [Labrys okinawensis]
MGKDGSIGVIRRVQRFPVKSMGSDVLDTAELRWNGLAGDRQYAFVKTRDRGRFPYLTGRDLPDLLLYRARYLKPEDPRTSALTVVSPKGGEYDIDDPALCRELSEAAGEPVHVMQLGRGHFDSAVVSLVSTTTAGRLAHAHGGGIDLRRFRINLVIEPVDAEIWERDWLGKRLAIGNQEALLRADRPIDRCVMITLDPQTAQRTPAIIKTVARQFDNRIGIYGTVEQPGRISLDDGIYLAG